MKQLDELRNEFIEKCAKYVFKKIDINEFWGWVTENFTLKKKESPKQIRSNQLNRYYWKVVIGIMAGETGNTPDDLHEMFKYKFLREEKRYIKILGGQEPLEKTPSTKTLSNAEFTDYYKKIQRWSAEECDIYIPDPNEADYDQIYKMYKLD